MFNKELYPDMPMFVAVPRERITLICPDCGTIEGVDKERWSVQSIYVNDPPVCSACGTAFIPVTEEEIEH